MVKEIVGKRWLYDLRTGESKVVGFVYQLRTLHVVAEMIPCRDAGGTRYKDEELKAPSFIGKKTATVVVQSHQ